MDQFRLRVGLYSIGLDAYWAQFEGLQERLAGYNRQIAGKLARPDIEIVNLGLIDTPEAAVAAGHRFRESDVSLIFLHWRPMRCPPRFFQLCGARRRRLSS